VTSRDATLLCSLRHAAESLTTVIAALARAQSTEGQRGGGPSDASPYVLIPRAAEITGYSVRAIELKLKRGVWVEGKEWHKLPDGHRAIDMAGFRAWCEGPPR
jgi:hypothetical protein